MKNLFFLAIALLFLGPTVNAQVPKKVVVEHFTNSRCSICAGANPGFYSNLTNQTHVIHLAIHPSSPYPACIISQHNVPENDGRTNYYGIYGSTPKFVIQGVLISTAADYSSSSIFAPYTGKTSPASIRIVQTKFAGDSMRSTIIIKTEATHTLGNLVLFVALAEDTLFYTSPNGETKHFDVFRKSLTGTSGINIVLPTVIGDSIIYTKSSPSNVAWDFARINTIAILQESSSKSVVQSESYKKNSVPTGISSQNISSSTVHVFVSDLENKIRIDQNTGLSNLKFTLYDLTGRKMIDKIFDSDTQSISTAGLSPGVYLYTVSSKTENIKTGKVVLQN